MSREGASALQHVLGGRPPDGLVAALDDDELSALAETIADARRRQSKALAVAGDKALGTLPAIVRIPVKRAIGA
jgi:hypothetical protein